MKRQHIPEGDVLNLNLGYLPAVFGGSHWQSALSLSHKTRRSDARRALYLLIIWWDLDSYNKDTNKQEL